MKSKVKIKWAVDFNEKPVEEVRVQELKRHYHIFQSRITRMRMRQT